MSALLEKKTFRFRIIRESVIISAVILGTYFLSMQLRTVIGQINATIITQNNIYGLHELHKETFDLLNEHLRSIKSLRTQIDLAYPPTEDISEFLKIIDTYATKHGVVANTVLGSATVSTIKQDDIALQTIAITIDITGEVTAIRSYIDELEHLPYFFGISSIDDKRDPQRPAFRRTMLSGTLWTKPEQTLTQRQQ